ncbi:MAG TPA: DUF1015 domain-containing protein [Candidatus Limnocylindrales bacterium]
MATVRPFRALRYSTEVVRDLGAVVAPPYDVISSEQRRLLVARDPRNVVRLDLPAVEPGDADDDERYRRAARLLRSWRSDGTLRRDPHVSFYPYEQTFRLPGDGGDARAAGEGEPLVRRGIFARLTLEPFGQDSGVRPHERTMSGPKEDRYRLLRATDVNTSPVIGLYEDPSGEIAGWLDEVATSEPPVADVTDDDGVRHRLWAVPADVAPAWLAARLGAGAITIADGHHRYETALRYRDERRRGTPAAEPAPWDELLALLLEPAAGPLSVLATHRVLRGLGDDGVRALRAGLAELFDIRRVAAGAELARAFGPRSGSAGGEGRFGLWTRAGGAILTARRPAFEPLLPAGGPALRRLDVTLLGVVLERLAGIDAGAVDAGARIAYTKDAAEAVRWIDEAHEGADAAFLLDPTPPTSIVAVAADGDVMPQKSTYVYPKAITGLVINPLE